MTATVELLPRLDGRERDRLVRRARLLAWAGIAWHGVEALVAIVAGLAAASIALVGFGIDSLVESLAGFVLLWRFAGARSGSRAAERKAQQLIAVSFFLLAAYVAFESARTLASGERAEASLVGIVLAVVTVPAMIVLARAKRRVGLAVGSHATVSEASRTLSAPTSRWPSSSASARTPSGAGGGPIPWPPW